MNSKKSKRSGLSLVIASQQVKASAYQVENILDDELSLKVTGDSHSGHESEKGSLQTIDNASLIGIRRHGTICRLVYFCNTYIPFCPYKSSERENKLRLSHRKLPYYDVESIDPSLQHTLLDGQRIPLHRWIHRYWIFERFDEGVELDGNGFIEITPEPVANHIAMQMAELHPQMRNKGNDDQIAKKERKMSVLSQHSSIKTEESFSEESSATNRINGDRTFNSFEAFDTMGVEAVCPDTVIEACCGCGGNTIQLARRFEKVIGIDLDQKRIECAKVNAKIYGVDSKIEFVLGDFIEWTKQQQQQQLSRPYYYWGFLSPPWGGESYKDNKDFFMKNVTECNVYQLLASAGQVCQNLCLYLPSNQNFQEILELGSAIDECALIVIESISVGISKKTKYRVVKYLNEECSSNLIFDFKKRVSRFLVDELVEKEFMVSSFEFLIKEIGVFKILKCLEECLKIYVEGGMQQTETPTEQRSKGGIFFQVIKTKYPDVYKQLNKFRKEHKIFIRKNSREMNQTAEKSFQIKKNEKYKSIKKIDQ